MSPGHCQQCVKTNSSHVPNQHAKGQVEKQHEMVMGTMLLVAHNQLGKVVGRVQQARLGLGFLSGSPGFALQYCWLEAVFPPGQPVFCFGWSQFKFPLLCIAAATL